MSPVKMQLPWEATFRRIRAVYHSEWLYAPKPSPADLDTVGHQLGIRFPASYRAFAEVFGLGGRLELLCEVLDLTLPPWASPESWPTVVDVTRAARERDPSHERFQRLVVFAIAASVYAFAFDPAEVRDARWNEYRIYSIVRGGPAVAVADSFSDWLRWVGVHYRFEDEEGDEAEPPYPVVSKPSSDDPAPLMYSRSAVRPKQGPDDREVKSWLSWGNGTVGAIARSIRQDRRAGAFPVLADALEEAGCANEDLLHSCRRGDPDIDGAWVLAVLLGKENR